MEKKLEVKCTHSEMMDSALHIHEITGGAPVEVSDGTRRVKIGPWIPNFKEFIKMGMTILVEYFSGKKEYFSDKNNKE